MCLLLDKCSRSFRSDKVVVLGETFVVFGAKVV